MVEMEGLLCGGSLTTELGGFTMVRTNVDSHAAEREGEEMGWAEGEGSDGERPRAPPRYVGLQFHFRVVSNFLPLFTLRGRSQMTSAKFSGFLTPSPPLSAFWPNP